MLAVLSDHLETLPTKLSRSVPSICTTSWLSVIRTACCRFCGHEVTLTHQPIRGPGQQALPASSRLALRPRKTVLPHLICNVDLEEMRPDVAIAGVFHGDGIKTPPSLQS